MCIGFGKSKKIAEFLPQFGSNFTVKLPPKNRYSQSVFGAIRLLRL